MNAYSTTEAPLPHYGNVHTPERLANESQEKYRERRARSAAINKANRQIGQGGVSSRKQFRDSMRSSGAMGKRIRAYVALTAAWAAKRITKAKLRDKHGAYTLVGSDVLSNVMSNGVLVTSDGRQRYGSRLRRMWLGGISSQRGY